jgi:carboxypeptidase Q
MRPLCLVVALTLSVTALADAPDAGLPLSTLPPELTVNAQRIADAALADHGAWDRLAHLTDIFGSRLSGSPSLEKAIDWALQTMREDGLDNVRGEPVKVPHWVRGKESLEVVEPFQRSIPVLGLGGTIGTTGDGITAPVLVVRSFDELTAQAGKARGRIVVWNAAFTTYGETVAYRVVGAVAAAKVGAVASLVRSVTPHSLRTLHTGGMKYEPDVPKIPTAAITVEDAVRFQRIQDNGGQIVLRLKLGAETLPDAPSRNTVAEIVGSEKPQEVVVVSGHLDSWDVGEGAMDDGGGAIAAWEAVRLIHQLGLRPRRTLRVVLWTNEENGLRGGKGYRDAHLSELANHVAAIESDNGVFKPKGFRFVGSPDVYPMAKSLQALLKPLGADSIVPGDGEADISPMLERGVPGFALDVDGTKYFWYHHTEADTLDKLDPHEVASCVGALAVLAYALADMPGRIPAAPPKPERGK